MDKYAHERFKPKIPSCQKAKISLLFDGVNLQLILPGGKTQKFKAVSGKPIKGKFDYSVSRQKQSFQGPIPAGEYWITFSELWENAWYKNASTQAWGDFRVTIHPYPKTNTYSRGGFFIHGGAVFGSAGCIDLAKGMNAFVKTLKMHLASSNCYITLSVKY